MNHAELRYQQLFEEVNKILWEYWDPQGINMMENTRNEYRVYAGRIINLLERTAPPEVIANTLLLIQEDSMALFGDRNYLMERNMFVASRLIQAYTNICS